MTTIEELITDLASDDEEIRRKSVKDIYSLSSSSPSDLTSHIKLILDKIRTSSDEYVLQQLGSSISTIGSQDTTLGTEYFDDILNTITYLADNYPMVDEINSPAGLCTTGLLESIRDPLTKK